MTNCVFVPPIPNGIPKILDLLSQLGIQIVILTVGHVDAMLNIAKAQEILFICANKVFGSDVAANADPHFFPIGTRLKF